MQLAKTIRRGLTLVEVAVGFLLLAMVGGLFIVFYARMFGLSRTNDTQLYASAQLDGVIQVFRLRAKQQWPSSVSVSNVQLDDFTYDVEDLGLVSNPINLETPLTLKHVVVRLHYTVRYDNGKTEVKEMSGTTLVGR